MKKAIVTEAAPKAVGPYSQAIHSGDFVFCSGTLPLDVATGNLIEGDVTAQTKQVCENLKAVLAAKNLGFDHVVKTTVFLTTMNDFAAMNAVYATYFSEPFPARSTIAVAGLPKNALVEIEAIAVRI